MLAPGGHDESLDARDDQRPDRDRRARPRSVALSGISIASGATTASASRSESAYRIRRSELNQSFS
jgi:hypothetical protein